MYEVVTDGENFALRRRVFGFFGEYYQLLDLNPNVAGSIHWLGENDLFHISKAWSPDKNKVAQLLLRFDSIKFL